uniref:ankyrin repeat domain-containing protein n=1 Tax=Endozoicomonas sp. SESOKO1 TaxID=2828742 RepID=UPI002148DF13
LNENKTEFPKIFDRYQFRQNIKMRLKTLDSLDQKESLLMTLIKYNEQALLEALMGRKDFNIDELRIFGETPLVYAIKQRSQWVINLLIKKQVIDPT